MESIANRVSIMKNGELAAVFDLKEKSTLFGESYELQLKGEGDIFQSFSQQAKKYEAQSTPSGVLHSYFFTDYETAKQVLQNAVVKKVQIERFENHGLSLEEIFVNISQQKDER